MATLKPAKARKTAPGATSSLFDQFVSEIFLASGEPTGEYKTLEGGRRVPLFADTINVRALEVFLSRPDLDSADVWRTREKLAESFEAYCRGEWSLALAMIREVHQTCKLWGYAITAGPLIAKARKFDPGRRPGSGSRVRKEVAKHLMRNPKATAAEVWAAIEAKPPKGMSVLENRAGRYIETTGAKDTGYDRFANIVSEERKKLTS